MDNSMLREISEGINTPAYVFSGDEFRKRAEDTVAVLGTDIHICYSIKANPFLLTMLPECFSNVEVCSPGELEICIAGGVDPSMIIYSGLNKGADDVKRALSYGAGLITAESRHHLDLIENAASEAGVRADVLVRASAGSQFGIDRNELAQILVDHKDYPSVNFVGVHFFTGTQKRKAREIVKETGFLRRWIEELREKSGLELRKIEYGTGLPAYMFRDRDMDCLEDAHAAEMAFLGEISTALKELAEVCDLTIEMGRFFAESCGHYFTKVVDAKNNEGIDYAIIDGGSHQIRYFGQMQGMQCPFISHISDSADGDTVPWTLCGSLCTTADVLARNAEFTGLKTGDTLVFHQAGAYALYECMSLFLSRDLPSVYGLDEKGLTLLRGRKESYSFNYPL